MMGRLLVHRPAEASKVTIIAEGESDWLTWVTIRPEWNVLGIFNGAWTDDCAGLVPSPGPVFVMTDADKAGHRYAVEVLSSLPVDTVAWRYRGVSFAAAQQWLRDGGADLFAGRPPEALCDQHDLCCAGVIHDFSDPRLVCEAARCGGAGAESAKRPHVAPSVNLAALRGDPAKLDEYAKDMAARLRSFTDRAHKNEFDGARHKVLGCLRPVAEAAIEGIIDWSRAYNDVLWAYVKRLPATEAQRKWERKRLVDELFKPKTPTRL